MNVLAIETSTDALSVALMAGDALDERTGERGRAHSDRILVLVRELLAARALELCALDGIAFGAGPGSFTGLRLGCAVAQGLAFGAGLPVIGVGSLEAMAAGFAEARVLACVDARMNEVYCAAYEVRAGIASVVIAPVVVDPRRVPVPPGGGWIGCGSGFRAYGRELRERLGGCVIEVREDAPARASVVARLARVRLARGEPQSTEPALPFYVRERVALTTAERLARGGKA
ncbi:MAG: tRNA (adenosine(37)-N6)-threonylcarbamoyltransferase complex dimerization subunit type 1 TsaB [Betaproteobacteria bacterium CG2_30_68_42]|nr:MAG: tRNA (adenosine(37)-N6)-threonylcarbamoyltransferase complex dimerization subunit type 1 TsaB [Betaproteobacteria bacterium CG2_30_68_42]